MSEQTAEQIGNVFQEIKDAAVALLIRDLKGYGITGEQMDALLDKIVRGDTFYPGNEISAEYEALIFQYRPDLRNAQQTADFERESEGSSGVASDSPT